MFNAAFTTPALKTAILGALAAATLATSPALAGGGGGGRDPNENISTISSPNPDGSTTSIRSKNGAETYTVTKTNKGKVVSKKQVKKKRGIFVTLHGPNGKDRTITEVKRNPVAFVTLHNADGTSTTITANDR